MIPITFMKKYRSTVVTIFAGLVLAFPLHAEEIKPIKALLITGGCCHDYAAQKDILKKGIESRANIIVDQIHTDDKTVTPDLPIYGVPEYAEGYDVVIHNECAAGVSDDETVKGVLAPHKAGTPGVNIHCGIHSYRIGDFKKPVEELGTPTSQWFEYVGLQSSGHGPRKPVAITFTDKEHPVTMLCEDWETGDEELYNNVKVLDTAYPLATGKQGKNEAVIVWTNDYKGTRVFNTTLGHFNETVEDARFLNLVTRGILWACGKMDDEGGVAEGYNAVKAEK